MCIRDSDYTNVTELFGRSFVTPPRPERPVSARGATDDERPPPLIVTVSGLAVQVTAAGRAVLVDGEPVPLAEYKARIAARVRETAATLEQFRQVWITPSQRQPLVQGLMIAGYPPTVVQSLEPVSYTHLDVYKRQVLHGGDSARTLAADPIPDMDGAGAEGQRRPGPVKRSQSPGR